MKKIKLSNNRYKNKPITGWAIVDDEDYFFCSWYAWNLSTSGYAYATEKGKNIPMSWYVLGIKSLKRGLVVDHINRNKLDNRKANLRVATLSQNGSNRGKPKNNKSGYKGVYLCKQTNKWRAEIKKGSKRHRLGRFDDIIEAAKAYDKAAVKLYGEYAVTNFSMGGQNKI